MNVLAFIVIVVGSSGIVHFLIKRFWLGVVIGAGIGGAVELISEILMVPSLTIRPVDLLFWGPFVAVQGALFSFPIVMIVGAAFLVARKLSSRRRSQVPNSD